MYNANAPSLQDDPRCCSTKTAGLHRHCRSGFLQITLSFQPSWNSEIVTYPVSRGADLTSPFSRTRNLHHSDVADDTYPISLQHQRMNHHHPCLLQHSFHFPRSVNDRAPSCSGIISIDQVHTKIFNTTDSSLHSSHSIHFPPPFHHLIRLVRG